METLKAPINTAFSGSIPTHYDAGLGPLFFEPYAQHLAQRVAALRPKALLELACGTGRLTRQLLNVLAPTTRLVATDVNPAMLDFAKRAIQEPGVEWDVVDAVSLPYPEGSFDVVVAEFGVMFYSDRPLAYREALRVLRPGGTLLFTSWSTMAENPVARITQEVVKEFFPLDTPAFYQVPFSYCDHAVIREEVLSAGFQNTEPRRITLQGQAATAMAASRGLLEGSPIHNSIMDRDPFLLPAMREALTARLAERFGSSELSVPLSAVVVEARKA